MVRLEEVSAVRYRNTLVCKRSKCRWETKYRYEKEGKVLSDREILYLHHEAIASG